MALPNHRADQQVRLIEPTGGTDDAFARAYLPKAQLNLHKTIFHELLDKSAGVMITYSSKALYSRTLRVDFIDNQAGEYDLGAPREALPRGTWKRPPILRRP